jgi:hypothetical protein
VIVYQGLWGLVLVTFYYVREWNGTEDFDIGEIEMTLSPFSLRSTDFSNVSMQIQKDWKTFLNHLTKWESEREAEIAAFHRK